MRDIHGRYQTTKTIAECGPDWANGCEQCTYGIVSAPELTGKAAFYLERLVQALNGDITFCTCRAGLAYRSSLLNRRESLLREARGDARMTEYAQRRSHPDLEAARTAIEAARLPTMHYEAVTA